MDRGDYLAGGLIIVLLLFFGWLIHEGIEDASIRNKSKAAACARLINAEDIPRAYVSSIHEICK